MVELVDTQDLKSCGHCGRGGSIPPPGTSSNAKCKVRNVNNFTFCILHLGLRSWYLTTYRLFRFTPFWFCTLHFWFFTSFQQQIDRLYSWCVEMGCEIFELNPFTSLDFIIYLFNHLPVNVCPWEFVIL